MWSSNRLLVAAGLWALGQSVASTDTPFTCPATITVAKVEHKFERPSMFNGTPGKQEYDLAPDDTQTQGKQVKQTWNVADYRDMNLFVRCRYLGTKSTVEKDIPAGLKTCVFTFRNVPGNQPVASPVFACK